MKDPNGKDAERGHQSLSDPAPEATMLPRERVLSIVNGVALTALDELRALRDQCDNLMRSLTERQQSLTNDIEEFAGLAQNTLETKNVISDALRRLTDQYVRSPVPETVAGMPKTQSSPWPRSTDTPRMNLPDVVAKYVPKPRNTD